jgi:ElaB/YqjD/DUF883 family membrane-anchored ribosome-binding protein
MCQLNEEAEIEATEDQLAELRQLGVAEQELLGLSSDDAQDWIDELRAKRQNAGRINKP